MPSFLDITIADNTIKSNGQPETGSVSIPITQLDDSGANTAEFLLAANLQTALFAVLLGNKLTDAFIFSRTTFSDAAAANILAQRENKFLCRFHNPATLRKMTLSLPTADISKVVNHTEFIALGSGLGLAIKTAWELVVADPADNTLTILDSMQFVGRNS